MKPAKLSFRVQSLPRSFRRYLNQRGISDDVIKKRNIGLTTIKERRWIAIPVHDKRDKLAAVILRSPPRAPKSQQRYTMLKGSKAMLYPLDAARERGDLLLCEGVLDALAAESTGIRAISGTAGAGTFKEEWLEQIPKGGKVIVCYDADEAGHKGRDKVLRLLTAKRPDLRLAVIDLPDMGASKKDVTDFLTQCGDEDKAAALLGLARPYSTAAVQKHTPVALSEFKPLTSGDLASILDLTIKKDNANKIIVFLCALSSYTRDSQFNISFNAPSSAGKSYIPLEIAQLFPEEDVVELGYCSPQAFFHDHGEFDERKGRSEINLARKLIIFVDQPHDQLLQRLRPLLSHDKPEITSKITDKTQKWGNRTKTVCIIGYPAVIFCTTGLRVDEQESTRFLVLSPEITQEKLRESVVGRIRRDCDRVAFDAWLGERPERLLLRERIKAVKAAGIDDVLIGNPETVEEIFLGSRTILRPRHQRDAGRFISLTKAFALLNFMFRERKGNVIVAAREDIEEAVRLWESIGESQELNLPPYVLELHRRVIVPAYEAKRKNTLADEGTGITMADIQRRHYKVYGGSISYPKLRQEILPMLESAGLIEQAKDYNGDGRRTIVTPIDTAEPQPERNMPARAGVSGEEPQQLPFNSPEDDAE